MQKTDKAEEDENRPIHLFDCIKLFTTQEKLSADDSWFCPQCQQFVQATKKLDLWKLPDILIVHLKRFQYNRYWRDKVTSLVQFPIEDMDLSPFVTNPRMQENNMYDLYAVSVRILSTSMRGCV